MWPEGRNRTMQRMLMDDPGHGAVFGRIRLELEADAVLLDWVIQPDGKHTPSGCIGTALFRTGALHSIDGFNEEMIFAEDYEHFDRLRDAGMRYVLPISTASSVAAMPRTPRTIGKACRTSS